jgi:hypothetical protein
VACIRKGNACSAVIGGDELYVRDGVPLIEAESNSE